jgi:hypothetical protein
MKYIEAQIKDGVLQLFNRTIIGSDDGIYSVLYT